MKIMKCLKFNQSECCLHKANSQSEARAGKFYGQSMRDIENRIYIREEFKESLGMNFFSPFQPERSSKCTNHINVHKLCAVEYINTVCSLDYISKFLKLLNKLYNELGE